MWELRERDADSGQDALFFALGAVGGFALGVLLSGRLNPAGLREAGAGMRERAAGLRARAGSLGERARGVAGSIRPARQRRPQADEAGLGTLEDAVLDAFLADDLLRSRGIDVGALSRGIVELSGSVNTHEEADRAVRVAQRVRGVETVVNRMDVEEEMSRINPRDEAEADAEEATEWTGRNVGMGRRRQGRQTDPARSDDSRHFRDRAIENADGVQVEDEDLTYARPRMAARPGSPRPEQTPDYREDELDNQDPLAGPGVSKHGARPQTGQPQELNSASRVGEGLKPGTELALEASDVPVKPHGDAPRGEGKR